MNPSRKLEPNAVESSAQRAAPWCILAVLVALAAGHFVGKSSEPTEEAAASTRRWPVRPPVHMDPAEASTQSATAIGLLAAPAGGHPLLAAALLTQSVDDGLVPEAKAVSVQPCPSDSAWPMTRLTISTAPARRTGSKPG